MCRDKEEDATVVIVEGGIEKDMRVVIVKKIEK